MYKKVALTVLFISLALLAVGIFIFVDKQTKDNENQPVENSAANPAENSGNEQADSGQTSGQQDLQPGEGEQIDWDKYLKELEAEVEKRAKAKFNDVIEAAANRRYTADERDFMTDPGLYIINEMEADDEITAEAAAKLKAKQE